MTTPASDLPLACATCELRIAARPVVHLGLAFCCAGCVVGGPCTCSYDEDPQPATEPERDLAAAGVD